jgi:hypothetical protein
MDLGKWLRDRKKQVQGVVAQVNPFDGGKTYNTVVHNAPIKSRQAPQRQQQQAPVFGPQQTPQQQQQQFKAPTLNSGNAFDNKIGGIDIQAPRISKPEQSKIQAATQRKAELDKQERLNKSEALKNLGKKYNTGQINRKQFEAAGGAILSDKKNVVTADKILAPKSGLDKTTNAIVGGFAESNPIKLAGDVIEFGGRAGEAVNLPGAKKIKNIGDKMNNFGDTQGTAMDGKYDSNIGLKVARAAPRLAQDTVLAIATGGGSAAPQLAGQASKLSKLKALLESGKAGTSLVGAIQGAQVANDISGDAEARGVNLKQAVGTGAAAGLVSGGVEKIGGDLLLNNPLGRKLGGNIASRALGGFVSEGSEEATQQVVENAARKTYNDEQKLLEGVPESFAVGGLMGAGAGTVTNRIQKNNISQQLQNDGVDKLQADKQADDIINNTNQNTPTPQVDPQVKQQLDSPDPVVQQTAQDKIAGQTLPKVTEMPTVQGMQERMRAAKQNVMESVSSFKDKYGIKGEGGFIAGPLAGDFSSFQKQGKVFEGVDGKPRFEVSDEGAKLNLQDSPSGRKSFYTTDQLKSGKDSTLSQVLDHPKLYEQYPGLKDLRIQSIDFYKDARSQAAYDSSTKTLNVSNELLNNPKELKEAILHEVQHSIQDIEGFAKGGSIQGEDVAGYNNLAGEAEARAVAARKDMTDGERYKSVDAVEYTKPKPVIKTDNSINLQDKNDVEQLSRILGEERVKQLQQGDYSHFRNPDNSLKYWEDIAKRKIIDEKPRTIAQQLEKRINPVKINDNRLYHGTTADNKTSILRDGFKKGSELPDGSFRGGGYDAVQNSISFSTDPKTASVFTGGSNKGVVIETKLKDGAKVVTVDGVDYAEDLNDMVSELRKQGVDAVYLEGEKEVAVINPKIVEKPSNATEFTPSRAKEDLADLFKKESVKSTFYDSLDVPKEDLIIRDGKGKAMSVDEGKIDPTAALKAELSSKSQPTKTKGVAKKTWKQINDEKNMETALRQELERANNSTPLSDTELQSIKDLSDDYIKKLRNSKSLEEAKILNKEYMSATEAYDNGTREINAAYTDITNSVDDAYMAARKAHRNAPQPTKGATPERVQKVAQHAKQEAKKYKTAEEFVEAARSIENFDPAEAKTIFKDVKTGDGEAGVVKALTEFYNKANPSTDTATDTAIEIPNASPEVVNEASNYKSQKEYINDLAKTARDLEQENKSGSIDLYNEKGAGNQGKQRYSAHSKFYSDYFKANGKKPPLYEYANAIEAELNGQGKSGMIPSVEDSKAVYNEIANQQQTALDNEAKVQQYTEADMPREVLLEQQLAEAQKRLAKKPRKPISQPVDTTPAIAKRVTQKENAEIAKLRKQIKNEKAQKQKKAAIEAKQRADRVAAKKAKLANKIPDTPKARAKVATNTIPDLFSKYLDHDNKGYNKLENEKGNIPVINKKGSYIESNRKTKDISRKNFKFAEESIAKGLHNMSKSDNKAARSIPRMLQYISKNAGQDPRMVEAASRFAGENTYTDSALLTLGEEAYKLLPDEASRERVHATLDPNSVIADMVKNKNNDYVEQRNAPKYDDLSKNEQKAVDMLRDMGEAINDSSYRAGMISQEVWQKNKGGKYIARMYEDIKNSKDVVSEVGISESAAQQLFTGMYKSREKLNDALREKMLRDPVKLAVIRARQVRNNEALSNYVQEADSSGYISDKPKDGWVKVPYDQANNGHMFMNNWGGKFMRRDVYENINGYTSGSQAINHMNNILDLYDGNPARRLRKKLLTVYNPVVRTGNITSNYLFAYLNGVNPATFTANKRWAKSVMDNKKGGSKGSDPLYIEAQRQGLIGNSILRSDRNLFNTDKEWQRDIKNRNVKTKFTDKVRDKVDRFEKRYGEADDLSKLSALKTHVDRGHSVADAIEMTKRGFQDYNRVGHMYDMGAKSPVFGNAFIRFQGDLWTGILKNAAIDHPLRLAALPVATYAMGQALSGIMGEDEEDKETRENRAGAPKIPFTDISTEFQTPFGAFDASRFLGVYNREDLDGNDFTDEISKLLPFNVINPLKLNTAEGKTDAVSKMASDPLIGPLLSVLFDTDYRGKSISDPDGVRNGQELFPDEKLSDKDKWRNRRQYLVEAYMPYPYREGSDIVASSTEKMRNEQSVRGGKNDPSNPDASFLEREGYNNSGSKKTVGQSLARLFGVRLEQYGEDEAKTQRERNEMFSFFDEVDDWKETLDTETRKKFDSRHKSNTSRSGVAEEFADNPFYKYKNAAELRDDNLFNAEKKYAEMQNKKDGKPIDPLFNLPKDQRNMVLWKNSLPPGAKDDAVTAMYDQDWYEQFRNEQGKYFGAKDKYAEKRGFNKFTDTNPYPKPTDELQGVIDGYYDLSSGQRTSWRNKNPGLYQQMKDQFAKQDEWTNTERVALGLAPIEDKYGKYAKSGSSGGSGRGRGKGRGRGRGRGRGGGRGGAAQADETAKGLATSYKLQADTLGKLNQLLNATTKKPTAGMNAGKKVVTKKPNLKKISVNMSSKG